MQRSVLSYIVILCLFQGCCRTLSQHVPLYGDNFSKIFKRISDNKIDSSYVIYDSNSKVTSKILDAELITKSFPQGYLGYPTYFYFTSTVFNYPGLMKVLVGSDTLYGYEWVYRIRENEQIPLLVLANMRNVITKRIGHESSNHINKENYHDHWDYTVNGIECYFNLAKTDTTLSINSGISIEGAIFRSRKREKHHGSGVD